jgi:regulator of replication initiation timing
MNLRSICLYKMAEGEQKCVCGSCLKIVQERHNAVKCYGWCNKWWHIACAGISKTEYDHFKCIFRMKGIKWYCESCMAQVCIAPVNDSLPGSVKTTEDNMSKSTGLNEIINELREIRNTNQTMFEGLTRLEIENKDIKSQLREALSEFRRPSITNVSDPSPSNDSPRASSVNQNHDASQFSRNNVSNGDEIVAEANNQEVSIKPSFVDIIKGNKSTKIDSKILRSKNESGSNEGRPTNLNTGTKNQRMYFVNSTESKDDFSDRGNEKSDEDGWNTVPFKSKIGRKHSLKANNEQNENRPRPTSTGKGPNPKPVRSRTNKTQVLVGTGSSENSEISGAKKAWFHLGKVTQGTSEEDVQKFVKKTFPNIDFTVEKLEGKGINESFKLGVGFLHKAEVMDCAKWPKNITLKRFLFLRTQTNQMR